MPLVLLIPLVYDERVYHVTQFAKGERTVKLFNIKKSPVKSGAKKPVSKKKLILSKKQKIIAAVGGILVLGGLGYAGYSVYTMNEVGAGGCVSHTYKQGSSGLCVKYIQKLINFQPTKKITVDGNFGPGTKDAVRATQKYFGLTADGVVSKKTWSLLCYPQMGWMDENGVGHQAWPSDGKWRSVSHAAGCKGA